jgi:hypothetical protein
MFLAVFEKKWWKQSGKNSSGESEIMSGDDDKKIMTNHEPFVGDDSSIDPELWRDPEIAPVLLDEDKTFEPVSTIDTIDEMNFDSTVDDEDADSNDELDESDSSDTDLAGDDDYDLAEEDDLDQDSATLKRAPVTSAKEFFNTELLYRFDLLTNDERDALKGSYRLEIRGNDGGVWSLKLDKDVTVSPSKNDAELVLMMHFDDFISVVNGKINPQIALASRRMKISGDSKKASLFQNILAPRPE